MIQNSNILLQLFVQIIKMKKIRELIIFLLICFQLLFITGCIREKLPSLSTTAVSSIGPTSAISGGNVISDGNTDIIVRGVCWDTKKWPSNQGDRTTDGYGIGQFTSSVTGLKPNTLYYIRAYATNKVGTAYGNQLTFTSTEFSIPILTTNTVTGITQTSAVSGGNITDNGGVSITVRGVCWSTHAAPTLSDNTTNEGTGDGQFISIITGLTGNTRYYVRAYATNSEGTGYGQEVPFTSSPLLPVVTTSTPSATSTTTGTGGGNVTSDGGSTVTARGVCWSLAANPTIATAISLTTDGTGTGPFSSNLTGLTSNTTYHVRAYATNGVGTSYGDDLTFTTDPLTVADHDGNTYNVVRLGTQLWLKENLKSTTFNDGSAIALVSGTTAWSNLTSQGYCWYNNDAVNKNIYGALYNWYAVNTGKLCPAGWHVATDADWLILVEQFLGGASPGGGKLKETLFAHWTSPNTGATDEYHFTALPGGWRTDAGTFQYIGNYGYWWTSTSFSPNAWSRHIQFDSDRVFRSNDKNAKYGMSVRCIRD